MNKNLLLPLVYIFFFLSGFCGLIYQVIWVRMFGLVFGNTLLASSTVLSAFMAGLAMGSFYAGKHLVQRKDSLRLYAYIELFVGICGLLMPFAIKVMSHGYGWIYQSFHPSFEMLTAIRLFLSFALIFMPCTLMGLTLPILSKYIADNYAYKEMAPGIMYGINTVGAVIGCFAAGFILIKAVGITQTGFIAAIINIVIAVGTYILYKKETVSETNKKNTYANRKDNSRIKKDKLESGTKRLTNYILITSCALSGFAALTLEIAWTKALARTFQMVWSFNMDSYAFVAMLAVLLAGIGIGSYLVSVFIHRIKNHSQLLYGIQFLLGVLIIISIVIIQNPLNFRNGLNSFVNASFISGVTSFFIKFLGAQALMQLLLAFVIVFIPAVLMGIAFPLFVILFFHLNKNIGKSVGFIYSANTLLLACCRQ
jgi:spermidine synthase